MGANDALGSRALGLMMDPESSSVRRAMVRAARRCLVSNHLESFARTSATDTKKPRVVSGGYVFDQGLCWEPDYALGSRASGLTMDPESSSGRRFKGGRCAPLFGFEPLGFLRPSLSARHKKTRFCGFFYVWRRGRDSNPRYGSTPHTRFPGEPVQPLRHLSERKAA